MKKIWKRILVIICIVLAGFIGFNLGEFKMDDSRAVTQETIEEILEPASELVAIKYNYEQFDTYEKAKEVTLNKKKVDIPFTKDQIVFTYGGTIFMGIDLKEVKFDIDNEKKIIVCSLPEIKIISHETDESKFQEYEIKNSIFTKTTWSDYNELSAELKEKQESKVLNDEKIINEAIENAQSVISDFIKVSELTGDYEVEFK